MENKKSKLPTICLGIIIVSLIAIIVLLINLNNKEVNGQNQNTDNTQNIIENIQNEEQENTVKSDEEIIKEQVLEYIEGLNEASEEKFLECRMDSVNIYTGKEKESILEYDQGQYYKESDILFSVKYSIKVQDPEKTIWCNAKSGPDEDGWIDYTQLGYMRNGKVEIVGTGW